LYRLSSANDLYDEEHLESIEKSLKDGVSPKTAFNITLLNKLIELLEVRKAVIKAKLNKAFRINDIHVPAEVPKMIYVFKCFAFSLEKGTNLGQEHYH
jgi:hypothetical protein